MAQKTTDPWWQVKAEIVRRFGTVSACARKLDCSDEALRQAAYGKCPGVAKKLKAALAVPAR